MLTLHTLYLRVPPQKIKESYSKHFIIMARDAQTITILWVPY